SVDARFGRRLRLRNTGCFIGDGYIGAGDRCLLAVDYTARDSRGAGLRHCIAECGDDEHQEEKLSDERAWHGETSFVVSEDRNHCMRNRLLRRWKERLWNYRKRRLNSICDVRKYYACAVLRQAFLMFFIHRLHRLNKSICVICG